jgi:hypothetical protein
MSQKRSREAQEWHGEMSTKRRYLLFLPERVAQTRVKKLPIVRVLRSKDKISGYGVGRRDAKCQQVAHSQNFCSSVVNQLTLEDLKIIGSSFKSVFFVMN